MKDLVRKEMKVFALIGVAASIIALSSLFTTVMVQFTQIFMYIFIMLMIPGFIAVKSIEAKANIASKAYLLEQKRSRFEGKKYEKKVYSAPTEVHDFKGHHDTFGVKFSHGLPDKKESKK